MEDKITPQEELNNMEALLAQIVNRATAYATDDQYKHARGAFQQIAVRATEARFWLLSGIATLFPPEEPKEEAKEEPANETAN